MYHKTATKIEKLKTKNNKKKIETKKLQNLKKK